MSSEGSEVDIQRELQGDLSSKCLKINSSMPKAIFSAISYQALVKPLSCDKYSQYLKSSLKDKGTAYSKFILID